jgi:hypothetical protein
VLSFMFKNSQHLVLISTILVFRLFLCSKENGFTSKKLTSKKILFFNFLKESSLQEQATKMMMMMMMTIIIITIIIKIFICNACPKNLYHIETFCLFAHRSYCSLISDTVRVQTTQGRLSVSGMTIDREEPKNTEKNFSLCHFPHGSKISGE